MMYGDHEALMTMNRAAYGDTTAALMGRGGGYGYQQGPSGALDRVGQMIRPIGYTAPSRVIVSYSGMHLEPQGFFSAAGNFMGFGDSSRSGTMAQHMYQSGSDFGERVASGAVVAGATAAGLGGALMASPAAAAGAKMLTSSLLGSGMVAGGIGSVAAFGMGAIAMPMAGLAAASQVTSAINERREMQTFLEATSSRFVGAGSAMADGRIRGMSRGARAETTDFIRNMDVQDKFLDSGDFSNILQEGVSRNLFTGSGNDMESFKTRFKEITEAVKVVTRTLNQTLQEGMQTIQQLKSAGVDISDVGSIVSGAGAMGRTAGRTSSEMLSIGLQGAEMFRGTGVNMAIGMQANMMNLTSVRAARDAKALTDEAIMQAGGEEALAQRMTASGLSFSQSGMGRGMMAAFTQGGQFNQGAFRDQIFGAGMDVSQLGMQAAGNLASPAAIIQMQANQSKIASEMGKSFGGQGLQIAQANAALANAQFMTRVVPGLSMEDAMKSYLIETQGEVQANVTMGMISGAEGAFSARQKGIAQQRNEEVIEEAYRNSRFARIGGAVSDVVTSASDFVARPAMGAINAVADSFADFRERSIGGVERARDVRSGVALPGFMTAGEMDFSVLDEIDLNPTIANMVGTDFLNALNSGDLGSLTSKEAMVAGISARGAKGGIRVGATRLNADEFRRVASESKRLTISNSQAQQMEEAGIFKGMPTKGDIGAMIMSGKLDDTSNLLDLASAVFGKNVSSSEDISREQMAFLQTSFKGTAIGKMIDNERQAFAKTNVAFSQLEVGALKQSAQGIETSRNKLARTLDGASSQVLDEFAVAMAAKQKGDPNADAMLNSVAQKYAATSGKDISKVREAISIASTEGSAALGSALELSKYMTMDARMRSQIGGSELASIVADSVLVQGMGDLSEAQRDQIVGAAESIALGGKIDDETIGLISKGGRKDIAQRLKGIKGLETLGDAKSTDAKRGLLKAAGFADEKRIMDILRTGETDITSLQDEASAMFRASLVTGDQVSGGRSGDVSKGETSAIEAARTQTAVNLEILEAMRALSAQLR
jgi:hypothetical protein